MQFRFESPLHDALEAQKGAKFLEMKALIAEAAAIDKSAIALPDATVALRDALNGIGVPANWIRSETTVEQMKAAEAAAQQAQTTLAAMQQGADVAATLATAQAQSGAAAPV